MGGGKWVATYAMQNGDSDGVIPFEVEGILDLSGNPNSGIATTTDGSIVVFDNTKPELDIVRIASNNQDSTWAKVGDMISINFIANELLISQSVNLNGQAMTISDLGSEKYLAQYEMTDLDAEGQLSFEILITDSVGLESDPIITTSNSSQVIFDKTLPILNHVNIQSNNQNNASIAITGDNVTLTFIPEEPLLTDSIVVTIANEEVTTNEDGGGYVATLTLSGNEPGGLSLIHI